MFLLMKIVIISQRQKKTETFLKNTKQKNSFNNKGKAKRKGKAENKSFDDQIFFDEVTCTRDLVKYEIF